MTAPSQSPRYRRRVPRSYEFAASGARVIAEARDAVRSCEFCHSSFEPTRRWHRFSLTPVPRQAQKLRRLEPDG